MGFESNLYSKTIASAGFMVGNMRRYGIEVQALRRQLLSLSDIF
ncbi:hypothetical protein FOQG_19116 [Fusarium oxysporum f. sp. raphani 54005]|uniref:Uncharacterized protein n=2 Tax=Fusarium oxysporum TaxID=5507 RepID=X0BC98_FUSOX|nr:hypothetical protein FOQG_19116 [Fusarium oxysporum f. sp. raphani 54005]EXL64324.1 hypothetical protein FOPG_19408 [Fusarium oxysporum f. sp. conglutinans race 2 54008]KAI8397498.1 hypothetical protein FOFC_20770 [Fusarium oxysporum]